MWAQICNYKDIFYYIYSAHKFNIIDLCRKLWFFWFYHKGPMGMIVIISLLSEPHLCPVILSNWSAINRTIIVQLFIWPSINYTIITVKPWWELCINKSVKHKSGSTDGFRDLIKKLITSKKQTGCYYRIVRLVTYFPAALSWFNTQSPLKKYESGILWFSCS